AGFDHPLLVPFDGGFQLLEAGVDGVQRPGEAGAFVLPFLRCQHAASLPTEYGGSGFASLYPICGGGWKGGGEARLGGAAMRAAARPDGGFQPENRVETLL